MSPASHLFRSPMYGNGAFISPPAPTTAKPKVVSIPVQFVRSDDEKKAVVDRAAPAMKIQKVDEKKAVVDRAAAAMKIQKAFRGFIVRKNVKIVRKIESEMEEIEMKFRADQGMDRIMREEKERLKINEMLMRMLFRLDSVRGVRDYRKSVIRRVIALQEMVDSISAARSNDESLDMVVDEAAVEEVETLESGDGDLVVEIEKTEPEEAASDESNADAVGELNAEESESVEGADPMDVSHQIDDDENKGEGEAARDESNADVVEKRVLEEEVGELNVEESESVEGADPMEVSHQIDDDENKGEGEVVETAGSGVEEVEICKELEVLEKEEEEEEEGGKKDEGGMKEVMERMVVENEKLKGLVAQLCERSAQQCRLMGGLAERVEHLEKMVKKMDRRKKKRKNNSTSPAS